MSFRLILCFLTITCLGQSQTHPVADSLRKVFIEEKDQDKKAGLYHDLVAEILETEPGMAWFFADTLEAFSSPSIRDRALAAHLRAGYRARSGDHREAVKFLHQEYDWRQQISDSTGSARVLFDLGQNFAELQITDSAFYYLQRSLDAYEQIGDFKQIACVLSAIGQSHSKMNHHALAVECFDRALKSCRSGGDDKGSLYALGNLALAFGSAGQMDSALAYAQNGLDLALQQEEYYAAGVIAGGLCQAYVEADRYWEAIPFGNLALHHLNRAGRKNKMAMTYLNLAIAYNQTGRPEEALKFSLPGYEILKEMKWVSPLKDYYEQIAISYERLGKSRDSLHWYKKFILINDSLSQTELARQVQAMEQRYHSQKAETEKAIVLFQESLETLEQYRSRSGFLASLSAVLVFGLLGMGYRQRFPGRKNPGRSEDF
ncbi:MAG TPA: tetratricopeptide repeat protein [Saprospiraceae bacterium]|nr:tetratricopeptide repeat protein [Saprospiraceae bacterium]